MTRPVSRLEAAGWSAVGLLLMALAIPWFLWGVDEVVYGLPVWIWWHAGWLALASVVFWLFTRRAWGIGVAAGVGGQREGDSA